MYRVMVQNEEYVSYRIVSYRYAPTVYTLLRTKLVNLHDKSVR